MKLFSRVFFFFSFIVFFVPNLSRTVLAAEIRADEEQFLITELRKSNRSFSRLKDDSITFANFRSKHVLLSTETDIEFEQEDLVYCADAFLNLRILCHPQWRVQTGKDAVLLVVSHDPAVMIALAKTGHRMNFIEELTRGQLSSFQQYAEGFDVEWVNLAGQRAIKVKAFDTKYPEIRLLDYYFVHDSQLYAIHCSIDPRASWDKYKYLINDVVESLKFISRKEVEKGSF